MGLKNQKIGKIYRVTLEVEVHIDQISYWDGWENFSEEEITRILAGGLSEWVSGHIPGQSIDLSPTTTERLCEDFFDFTDLAVKINSSVSNLVDK